MPSLIPTLLPLRALHALLGCFVLAWAGSAAAQVSPQMAADLSAITQRWLDDALAQNAQALPLRMEVSVGTLDPRLTLAPCARVQPYLPAGSKLWGRTRLGLKCVEGAVAWNVFLPVTVRAFGPAWVLNGNVASGAVLTQADASQAEVDWAADAAPVVANESWVGQIAARPLVAGQALRQPMLKTPDLFRAGAQVRVVAQGPGFAVTSAGQALSAGGAGQIVRVRMDNGRIVSGIVNENGAIDVAL
ncbi:MAG: flagellar basal body P-ring formation chaperone FlgA [Acidovorax sp.]|uniref:flagellar basal body P-ring formation chaperone FlgA n=1 Tax=Acidovorax sp. TaxID=1872122 RepID=UPI0039E49D1E